MFTLKVCIVKLGSSNYEYRSKQYQRMALGIWTGSNLILLFILVCFTFTVSNMNGMTKKWLGRIGASVLVAYYKSEQWRKVCSSLVGKSSSINFLHVQHQRKIKTEQLTTIVQYPEVQIFRSAFLRCTN